MLLRPRFRVDARENDDERVGRGSEDVFFFFFFFFFFFVGEDFRRAHQRGVAGMVDVRGGVFTRGGGGRRRRNYDSLVDFDAFAVQATHEAVREPEHGSVLTERDEGTNSRHRGQFLLAEVRVESAVPDGLV